MRGFQRHDALIIELRGGFQGRESGRVVRLLRFVLAVGLLEDVHAGGRFAVGEGDRLLYGVREDDAELVADPSGERSDDLSEGGGGCPNEGGVRPERC